MQLQLIEGRGVVNKIGCTVITELELIKMWSLVATISVVSANGLIHGLNCCFDPVDQESEFSNDKEKHVY